MSRWVYWLILASACVGVVALNWPGHYSWDSVSALYEGRFRVRETWHPAIYGWLLGVVDRVTPNASGIVGLSCLLLFGSWAALAKLRPRVSWLAPPAALLMIALPQVVIYPAIVWKDVLFAETAVAGFVLLALAAPHVAERAGWPALAAAGLLFAAAGLLRQNGLILAVFAAAALAWIGWRAGRRRSLGVAGAWLAGVLMLTLVFSATLRPQGAGAPDDAGVTGLRLLKAYDVVAALALQPGRPIPAIAQAAPAAAQVLRTRAAYAYTPERVDMITNDVASAAAIKAVPPAPLHAEWLALITRDPGLYLEVRAAAFRQVFATPAIDRCLPVRTGLNGSPEMLRSLGMSFRKDPRDRSLRSYAAWFIGTPAMSHVAYAVLAVLAGAVLLVRRQPADIAMAALLGGALVFTSSFFVISIACDYRYLYLLDLAALTALLYLAVDPVVPHRPLALRASGRLPTRRSRFAGAFRAPDP